MNATNEPLDRPYPGQEDIRALVEGLGPDTLFDLFHDHGVPEGDRFRLIEEVLGLLVAGGPMEDLSSWFLETLEKRCRVVVAARERDECETTDASGFRLVGRVEYLCQASQDEVFRDPRRAVELAERAVELADRIDPAVCGEEATAEQRILARAWLGNAIRVSGNHHQAEMRFLQTLDLLDLSTPQPTRARVWSLLGSLRADQGRFDDARPLLDQAMTILRRLRITTEECVVSIKLAYVEGLAGHAEKATQILLAMVGEVDPHENPRLHLILHHDLLTWMLEAGRTEEAIERFDASQTLYERQGQEPRLRLRRRWLEGRISVARGDLAAARDAFEDVRRQAMAVPSPYASASVSLELSLVLLREGAWERVEDLAQEMISFFRSQDIHHYLFAALQLLQQAVRDRTATIGLVLDVQQYFRRSWKSPEVPFERAEL